MIEIARPLLEGEEIALAVVEYLEDFERRVRQLVEEIMQHEERVISAIDVFDHVG